MILRLYPSTLRGSVTPPPSKSLLHRELICRCLAGQSTVLPPHAAQDVLATAHGLEQLTAVRPVVHCGDSGSTLRFLLPLFMALGRTGTIFAGSERLLSRPIPADLGLQSVPGGQLYRPAPEHSEPDWSAAAFWLALDAAQKRRGRGGLHVPMGRPPYWQGDAAIMRYVNELPEEIDISATPDLLPPLALLAAVRPGVITRFTHAAFLRRKESDRLAAVAGVLRALGVPVEEQPDGLTVTGTETLHGGNLDGCGDHRIAMLAGCAAMLADGPVTLRGAETVAKSYPTFWRDMAALGGRWEVLET